MKTIVRDDRGFTLVELAIVMIIIGLLIGGVLKGQQLVDNAKVTATLSQVKSYQAAINSFLDTYGMMPGDMRNASTRLPGCDGTLCLDGDADGFISLEGTNGISPTWDEQSADLAGESGQAWKHLSLAGLVTGIDSSADLAGDPAATPPVAGTVGWGISHPSSNLRGGFELFYDTDMSDAGAADVGPASSGLLLRLSNTGLGGTLPTAGAEPATPTQAANMDRKLDDDNPSNGIVFTNPGCSDADGAYDEQTDQRNCVVFFVLDS